MTTPALELHFAPGACSFVPHAMLNYAGAAFEPRMVKLHKGEQYSDAYKAINPHSQVPVLVVDGVPITQVLAITTYLDAVFPEAGFLPTDPLARAQAMQLLAWMNSSMHISFMHYFMPHKFSDDVAAQASIKEKAVAVYRSQLAELQTKLPAITGALRGKASVSPIDLYTLTLLRWGSMAGINPQDYPQLWAQVQTIATLPSVAHTIANERLQINLFTPSAV